MKHLLFASLAALAMSGHTLHARTGCLAKSYDLTQPFDTKELHPVSCTCDCDYHEAKGKYTSAQNQCLECTHFHYPRPLIFVTKIRQMSGEFPQKNLFDLRRGMQHLIDQYKRQNNRVAFDK